MERTLMMLRGSNMKGMFRLTLDNGVYTASASVPDLQAKDGVYGVYVFYSEDMFEKVGELKAGEMQASFKAHGTAKAAGVAQNHAVFSMTGENGDFDWERAKSMFYLKNIANADKPRVPGGNSYEFMRNQGIPVIPDPPAGQRVELRPPPREEVYVAREPEYIQSELDNIKLENINNEDAGEEEELIQRAREAFDQANMEACDQCPLRAKKTAVHPFSKQYKEFEWEKTEYPGLKGYWHYITGRMYVDGRLAKIAIGVPGDYALNPPSWLYGFDTYAFADDGEARGYWILFEEA